MYMEKSALNKLEKMIALGHVTQDVRHYYGRANDAVKSIAGGIRGESIPQGSLEALRDARRKTRNGSNPKGFENWQRQLSYVKLAPGVYNAADLNPMLRTRDPGLLDHNRKILVNRHALDKPVNLYHGSHGQNAESISHEGLRGSQVFFTPDLNIAKAYGNVDGARPGIPGHVYHVSPTGREIRENYSGKYLGQLGKEVTRSAVPAEHLNILDKHDVPRPLKKPTPAAPRAQEPALSPAEQAESDRLMHELFGDMNARLGL